MESMLTPADYSNVVSFRSVRDLARLSLKDPVYVSVHEHAKYSTPEQLRQVISKLLRPQRLL